MLRQLKNNWKDPSFILGISGLVLAIFDYFDFGGDKEYIKLLVTVVFGLLLIYWFYRSSRDTLIKNIQVSEIIYEAKRANAKKIWVLANVGTSTEEAIRNNSPWTSEIELKLILRNYISNPEVKFPESKERIKKRKRELLNLSSQLRDHNAYGSFEHRLADYQAFNLYTHEPIIKAILIQKGNYKLLGYFGFYNVKSFGKSGLDYSAHDMSLLEVHDQKLLKEFQNWFNHYWEITK